MNPSIKDPQELYVSRTFTVAWYWFLLATFIAITIRWMQLHPVTGWNLNYIRHAHSHVAFLGWVFNGFFAISLQQFVPPARRRSFYSLFLVLQVAVAGMAASFPLQGYGAVSIVFSTLHMSGSAVFAWWLWRSPLVHPGAGAWLRMALAFMLLSGLGPLVLGPLAALDLRDHPAYMLAIYFYLHCQYNGWFILFLIAAAWQRWEDAGGGLEGIAKWSAWLGLGGGALGSFALSALWLDPPWPVWLAGGLAALAQLWGAWQLRPLFRWGWSKLDGPSRMVLILVAGCFVIKLLLQVLACLPVLAPLADHRFIAVAFLHLVFLGVVTPAIACWAWNAGWIRRGWLTRMGGLLFLAGSLFTELVLVASALAGQAGQPLPFVPELLVGAAGLILAGLLLVHPTVK